MKVFLRTVIFLGGVLIIYQILGLFLIDDNSSTRITFHDFYNEKENIDVITVGTSRSYMGFDPEVFDKIAGENSFNLGTSSQTLDGSYYIIKEALERYNIKTVFLSVEFDILTRTVGGQKNTCIISDYMRGTNRFRYIFDVSTKDSLPIFLSRVYRDRNSISIQNCMKNFCAKMSSAYLKYENRNDYYSNYKYYIHKGLCYRDKENDGYDFFAYKEEFSEFDVVQPNAYNNEMIGYLYNIIELCKEKDIELILFTMPETDFYISQSGDKYDEFHEFMTNITEEYEVPYYDFNFLLDDNFSDYEFVNLDHLTYEGAKHFSKILADIYRDNNSHLFCTSIKDKDYSDIIGVLYDIQETEEGQYEVSWNILGNVTSKYLSKFQVYSEEGELLFETDLLDTNNVENVKEDGTKVIEIYNDDGTYVGKAKLL